MKKAINVDELSNSVRASNDRSLINVIGFVDRVEKLFKEGRKISPQSRQNYQGQLSKLNVIHRKDYDVRTPEDYKNLLQIRLELATLERSLATAPIESTQAKSSFQAGSKPDHKPPEASFQIGSRRDRRPPGITPASEPSSKSSQTTPPPLPPRVSQMLAARPEKSDLEQGQTKFSTMNALKKVEAWQNQDPAFVITIQDPEKNYDILQDAKMYAKSEGNVVSKDDKSIVAVFDDAIVTIEIDRKKGATISVKCDNTEEAQNKAFERATNMVMPITEPGYTVKTETDNTIKQDVETKVDKQAGTTYEA